MDNYKAILEAHFCQNLAEKDEEQSTQYLIHHQKLFHASLARAFIASYCWQSLLTLHYKNSTLVQGIQLTTVKQHHSTHRKCSLTALQIADYTVCKQKCLNRPQRMPAIHPMRQFKSWTLSRSLQ